LLVAVRTTVLGRRCGPRAGTAHRDAVAIEVVTSDNVRVCAASAAAEDRGPRIVPVGSITPAQFDGLYREVLEPAFPAAELLGLDELSATYRTSAGSPGLVALRGNEPVGVALGDFHSPSGVALLGYLAVRADVRSTGLGRILLRDAIERWQAALEPRAILAEVEDPRHHAGTAYGDARARLRFYQRAGAGVLPVPYFQPSLGPGLGRVRGMFLLSLVPAHRSVPTREMLAFLDDYVLGCEGEAGLADAEYQAFQASVRRWEPAVPVWPMSRSDEITTIRPWADDGDA
jgi:GNAT superfamily N-acetyltransferase